MNTGAKSGLSRLGMAAARGSARRHTRSVSPNNLFRASPNSRALLSRNAPSSPITARSLELATQHLKRIVCSHFPPFDVVDDDQFIFLLKRFGITESKLISKIRNETQLGDHSYDNARLKKLFSDAVDASCERRLPQQLHQPLIIAMAKEKKRSVAPLRESGNFSLIQPEKRQQSPPPNDKCQERIVTLPPPKRPPPIGNKYLPGFYDYLYLPARAEKKSDEPGLFLARVAG
jgi:hypothetical protein